MKACRVIYHADPEFWRQLFKAQQIAEEPRVGKAAKAAAKEFRRAAADLMFGDPSVDYEVDNPDGPVEEW